MIGQRVVNNILGNKPKTDRKSKNLTIGDLDKRTDLKLIDRDYDVAAIKEYLGNNASDYDGFLVKEKNGELLEVYGFEGNIPRLEKNVYKIR